MRICVISHGGLREALIQEGHEVFFLSPPNGLCDLEQVLKQESFCPDLIVQAENLGGAGCASGAGFILFLIDNQSVLVIGYASQCVVDRSVRTTF